MSIFEESEKGQRAYSIPFHDAAFAAFAPSSTFRRAEPLNLPEISEINLTRHFSRLARKNVGIDTHFYPLGSCTMKLNPRVNEQAASLKGFTKTHPLAEEEMVQGNLEVVETLLAYLMGLCGMEGGTLHSNAGAQGEFVGAHMMVAYHQSRGDYSRDEMLIPDNAHGTNPATATMVGLKTITLPSNETGDLDLESLKSALGKKTCGLMLTNPSTLGLFSPKIAEISKMVHEAGGLLYYDGANLNPLLGVCRPGDMGFDVMHINLHKTFSTPHGGGGPGSGPVLCTKRLLPFLPNPHLKRENEKYVWKDDEKSIGHISTFYGNFTIYLRAYLYILLHGLYGLRRIAEISVLNANYLKKRFEGLLTIPFKRHCMHEFVVQGDRFLKDGISASDIVKRLLDYGIHAPTVYFPLIVKEALLIEPTESESKRTLDQFIEAMEAIIQECQEEPDLVRQAPLNQSVSRLDEVKAAKEPVLTATGSVSS